MLTKNINFNNFKLKKNNNKIKKDLKILLKENNTILQSLGKSYKNSYKRKTILGLKKYSHMRVVGMGGSILGIEAINDFLKGKIKKKFSFYDNLKPTINFSYKKNKYINIFIR